MYCSCTGLLRKMLCAKKVLRTIYGMCFAENSQQPQQTTATTAAATTTTTARKPFRSNSKQRDRPCLVRDDVRGARPCEIGEMRLHCTGLWRFGLYAKQKQDEANEKMGCAWRTLRGIRKWEFYSFVCKVSKGIFEKINMPPLHAKCSLRCVVCLVQRSISLRFPLSFKCRGLNGNDFSSHISQLYMHHASPSPMSKHDATKVATQRRPRPRPSPNAAAVLCVSIHSRVVFH